jgi:hypothetical protein
MEVDDPQPNPDERIKGYIEKLLKDVKRIQSNYWSL